MSDDRFLRAASTAAVLVVAAIAAVISFIHIRELAVTHGQTQLAAVLLPFSIDGTVVASSLVLLRAARLRMGAPWLAQVMLLSSVVATLAANVTYGAGSGVIGALISGWPAYAFIGCAETAIMMVRRTAREDPGTVCDVPPAHTVPATTLAAAETWFRATVAVGNAASVNKLRGQFPMPRGQATELRQRVLAETNGHGPDA